MRYLSEISHQPCPEMLLHWLIEHGSHEDVERLQRVHIALMGGVASCA
jgi:hypothetical protein